MATIGDILTTPESGWRRYDNTQNAIKYNGTGWSYATTGNYFNSTWASTRAVGDSVEFYFTGTKLRIISAIWTDRGQNISIKIDDANYSYTEYHTTKQQNQSIVFEKLGLPQGIHYVKITALTGATISLGLDAIDIDSDGELRLPYTRMSVKNPITNQQYSLSYNTLIHIPSASSKNMILYGIEQGKEIQLDVPFTKMKYIQDTSGVLGIGKTFTHEIDMTKVKVNKLIL